MLRFKTRNTVLALVASVLCTVNVAQAGVSTTQSLDFGVFIVPKNDAQYDVSINTLGNVTTDATLSQIEAPQVGIYVIDGLTPGATVSNVVVTEQSSMSFSAREFNLVNFEVSYPATVNGAGELTVTIGATARTTGNATSYITGKYNGMITVQVILM